MRCNGECRRCGKAWEGGNGPGSPGETCRSASEPEIHERRGQETKRKRPLRTADTAYCGSCRPLQRSHGNKLQTTVLRNQLNGYQACRKRGWRTMSEAELPMPVDDSSEEPRPAKNDGRK